MNVLKQRTKALLLWMCGYKKFPQKLTREWEIQPAMRVGTKTTNPFLFFLKWAWDMYARNKLYVYFSKTYAATFLCKNNFMCASGLLLPKEILGFYSSLICGVLRLIYVSSDFSWITIKILRSGQTVVLMAQCKHRSRV